MYVLPLEGWRDSAGLGQELMEASLLKMPILVIQIPELLAVEYFNFEKIKTLQNFYPTLDTTFLEI